MINKRQANKARNRAARAAAIAIVNQNPAAPAQVPVLNPLSGIVNPKFTASPILNLIAPSVKEKVAFECLPGRTLPSRPGQKQRAVESSSAKAARVRSIIKNAAGGYLHRGKRVTHARSRGNVLEFKVEGQYIPISTAPADKI